MKLKRKKKSYKMKGNRTHGKSAKLNKGSGNRGGKGFSGTGKRADQKKTKILKKGVLYFGKRGITSKSTKKKKTKIINLMTIEQKFKPGEVKLEVYKVLGEGELTKKFVIHAKSASKSAIEKIEKAGGKVFLKSKDEEENIEN